MCNEDVLYLTQGPLVFRQLESVFSTFVLAVKFHGNFLSYNPGQNIIKKHQKNFFTFVDSPLHGFNSAKMSERSVGCDKVTSTNMGETSS
jgi:hypothetical protein